MFIVGTSFLPSHYPLVKKERKKKKHLQNPRLIASTPYKILEIIV